MFPLKGSKDELWLRWVEVIEALDWVYYYYYCYCTLLLEDYYYLFWELLLPPLSISLIFEEIPDKGETNGKLFFVSSFLVKAFKGSLLLRDKFEEEAVELLLLLEASDSYLLFEFCFYKEVYSFSFSLFPLLLFEDRGLELLNYCCY